jgi:hypothetical protein
MRAEILGVARTWWCHFSAASVAAFIIAPLTFMALDREEPVVITGQRLEGDMVPGGKLLLVWEAQSKRQCEGTVRPRIISSTDIVYDYDERPTVIRGPRPEAGRYALEFELPNSISPGPARREVTVSYTCNVLQRALNWPIRANREPIHFVVRPPVGLP